MANSASISELQSTDAPINGKRRRKKSMVWDHFTIEKIDAECTKARCMECKKSFAYISGSKLAGTSHLKRHISLGICPANGGNEKTGRVSPCTPLPTLNPTQKVSRKRHKVKFEDCCTSDIAKMIIMHDYPFDIVECPAFLNCVKSLRPQFPLFSIDAVERSCLELYQRERQNLLNVLDNISGRVNLSLEMYHTDQSVGYTVITGQFIDQNWNLHRKILLVVLLPFPDSDSAFNRAVLSCISDWNLENKVLGLTLDESFANKSARTNLRNLLYAKNPLFLNGKFLIGSCYSRVLSHLANDAITSLTDTVKKVRDSVKYVVTMDVLEHFNDLKLQLQVPSAKSLVLDDQTQWNTTYHMLVAACELKEVFSCLDTFDTSYVNSVSMDEWKKMEILCIYLKSLLDAANLLTGPTYPTTNSFFHEAWKLELELRHAVVSDDSFVRSLTWSMHERFHKYWKDNFLVLSIAVVLDPRFKMKLVEISFTRLYGDDADQWIKAVNEGVRDLFCDYVVQMLPTPTFEMADFDVYISDISSHQNTKRDLDEYLEEKVLPRIQDFDVLGWWKENEEKYPTLSKMASDILCIPVSTVTNDSVFELTCKKMDRYRCSLKPSTLEALTCAKDWMQNGFCDYLTNYSPLFLPKSFVKSEF
ncbi:zinc finger BED domain-containing protein RICESLEEPER 2-like [Rutidosis leptorrhynchoides]|uniref:zinc finger BED domain-containing protein RICESLEEPER 2-like n=1 Tax=Rutidosis leptorrhynchoides TaxID=125765 RepID=UPI003A9A0D85